MKKNGVEELSEEDNENINKTLALYEDLSSKIHALAQTNSNFSLFDANVNVPPANTIQEIKSIFRKRIIITRTTNPNIDIETLRNRMAYLCAKYDYLFIPMDKVLAEAKKRNPYGFSDPQTVLDIIRFMINSNKRLSRNVMIFNYLIADLEHGNQFYPSSKDEIFFLHHHVGKIRAGINFGVDPEDLKIQDELEEKVVIEKPVKQKNPDGEDEEPEPEPEDEGKKKFNPNEYQWYRIADGLKTFPQFYNHMCHTEKVYIKYTDNDFAELHEQFYRLHNEMEDGHDKYYYIEALQNVPEGLEANHEGEEAEGNHNQENQES